MVPLAFFVQESPALRRTPIRIRDPPSHSCKEVNVGLYLLPVASSHRRPSPPVDAAPLSAAKVPIHQDADGNCIFGQKSYWDAMYTDNNVNNDRTADQYSWYCGWDELAPFWTMMVPNPKSRVLIAGIGNDPAPVGMYDAGYTDMIAFDYSEAGVKRAGELFGVDRSKTIKLITADARNLPLEDGCIDATLDKGTLDAIYITGEDIFVDSVRELGRVTAEDGIVLCISRVIWPDDLMGAFDTPEWENIHDGSLAFAPDGEATIDLGAEMYSWRRTSVPAA